MVSFSDAVWVVLGELENGSLRNAAAWIGWMTAYGYHFSPLTLMSAG